MANCAGCSAPGPGGVVSAPPEAALGVQLGAGQLSTDTRLGFDAGGGSGVNTSPGFDLSKHPYSWLILLAVAVIAARKVMA